MYKRQSSSSSSSSSRPTISYGKEWLVNHTDQIRIFRIFVIKPKATEFISQLHEMDSYKFIEQLYRPTYS